MPINDIQTKLIHHFICSQLITSGQVGDSIVAKLEAYQGELTNDLMFHFADSKQELRRLESDVIQEAVTSENPT